MNRVDWMTPEEVLLILGGWAVVALLMVIGGSRMYREKRRQRQVLRDITDLDRARRAAHRRRAGREGGS